MVNLLFLFCISYVLHFVKNVFDSFTNSAIGVVFARTTKALHHFSSLVVVIHCRREPDCLSPILFLLARTSSILRVYNYALIISCNFIFGAFFYSLSYFSSCPTSESNLTEFNLEIFATLIVNILSLAHIAYTAHVQFFPFAF